MSHRSAEQQQGMRGGLGSIPWGLSHGPGGPWGGAADEVLPWLYPLGTAAKMRGNLKLQPVELDGAFWKTWVCFHQAREEKQTGKLKRFPAG